MTENRMMAMQKYSTLLLTFFGALLFTCCESSQKPGAPGGQDTTVITSVVKKGKDAVAAVDTVLPYWNSEMSRTGPNGYIDTFSVDSHLFRIVHHTDEADGILEKWQGNGWSNIAEFVQIGNHNSYDRDKDVNDDGFIDILSTFKWDAHLYLYNPAIQSFTSTPIESFSTEWFTLDPMEKIYCCRQGTKWATGYSDLYQFKGMQKIVLYRVGFIAKKEDLLVMDKVVLYKVNNNNTEDLTEIEQLHPSTEDVWDFEYETFWQKRYKTLLHL